MVHYEYIITCTHTRTYIFVHREVEKKIYGGTGRAPIGFFHTRSIPVAPFGRNMESILRKVENRQHMISYPQQSDIFPNSGGPPYMPIIGRPEQVF